MPAAIPSAAPRHDTSPLKLPESPAQVSSSKVAVSRFPGLAIYYTDTLKGLPQVFEQLLATAPTLHRIVVFLHIRQVGP